MRPWGYPAARPREETPHTPAAPVYERYESPAALVTTGAGDAEVITFSGKPDSILLSAQAFGALFTLTDRLNRETHRIHVPAGAAIETFISRERVLVRDAVAGSNAIVGVTGVWQLPRERG